MAKRYFLTLDELCELLRIETWDRMQENYDIFGSDYTYAYNVAIREGKSEEEAEEEGRNAEGDAWDNYFQRWLNALEATAETYFGWHGMTVRRRISRKYWIRYEVRAESWAVAASRILETINGYGLFTFDSVKDLKDSIPVRSDREVTLQHLHWMSKYGQIYGELSPVDMMQRRMR